MYLYWRISCLVSSDVSLPNTTDHQNLFPSLNKIHLAGHTNPKRWYIMAKKKDKTKKDKTKKPSNQELKDSNKPEQGEK